MIVGAGSLVNRDLEGGYVYAGVPARPICEFDVFVEKRSCMVHYPKNFHRNGDSIPPDSQTGYGGPLTAADRICEVSR